MKAAGVRSDSYARVTTAASRLRNASLFRAAVAGAAIIVISAGAHGTTVEQQPEVPSLPQQWAALGSEVPVPAPAPQPPSPTRRPR